MGFLWLSFMFHVTRKRAECETFSDSKSDSKPILNLKSFSDSISKSDSKSFSAKKQKGGNLKSPCFYLARWNTKVRLVLGLWALCGEKIFWKISSKTLDKAVRVVYNFAAINGLFVGFALLHSQPEEQPKQLHSIKSNQNSYVTVFRLNIILKISECFTWNVCRIPWD